MGMSGRVIKPEHRLGVPRGEGVGEQYGRELSVGQSFNFQEKILEIRFTTSE